MNIKKYRPLIINIGLSFFSIIATLVILEVLLRFLYPPSYGRQQILTYHPQAGYQLQKNLDIDIDTGNGPFRLVTNEYGYVGESYPLQKPENEFRIAHFGDSYTEGIQMVDWDSTFVSLIGKNLNARLQGPARVRSMNFGISGRGTIEEFWTYKYVAQQAHPDLNVVWFNLSNDFPNNYLPITNYAQLASNKTGGIKYVLKKSALISFVFERLKNNLAFLSVLQRFGLSNRIVYPDAVDAEKDAVPFETKIIYSTTAEFNAIQEKTYEITKELFRDFKETVRQNNEKLLVVLIPDAIQLSSDLQDKFFKTYPDTPKENYDFLKAQKRIVSILEEDGIEFLDLANAFKQYNAKKSDSEYCGNLFGDHFSPCGHRVVAKIVSEYIMGRYIPASH